MSASQKLSVTVFGNPISKGTTYFPSSEVLNGEIPFTSVLIPGCTFQQVAEFCEFIDTKLPCRPLEVFLDLSTGAIVLRPLCVALECILISRTWYVTSYSGISFSRTFIS